jgi:glycosyltransferase involved in cell wall biosynthesis
MIGSGYDGCNYYRIMLPAWHNGFYLDRPTLAHKRGEIENIKGLLDKADVVVFHRPENEKYHRLADLLKKDGKKIVMDNDDTFKLTDIHPLACFKPDATKAKLNQRDESIDNFILKSDLVTTSTEFLAKEYRKLSDKVLVLPNCIDPMDWDEPLPNETGKVRIGMVGSVAYEYDYLHLKPLITKLSKRNDVRFVLFGLGDMNHRKKNPNVTKAFKDEYKFWDSIPKDHFAWVPMHLYQEQMRQAKLDIMLVPRKDNYFNRCKSNVKFLEAAMLEIPIVAQSFPDGPYEEIENCVTGMKVTGDEWETVINYLIDNPDKRKEIGRNARQYALEHYHISKHAHKWAEAYASLF